MPRANSSVPRRKKHKKSLNKLRVILVPVNPTIELQKMQFKELCSMPTEIEDKRNVISDVYGLLELMLQLEIEV